jgi:hypothetical protein
VAKLHLPSVTLCAATSVNVDATIAALSACIDQVRFANCLLFTDGAVTADHRGISVVPLERLSSSSQYSNFMLRDLVDHVRTPHCLVVQWDGFVLDARSWDPQFLEFDYIGAPWPQFDDGHDVGNGGFSLRSRKLLEACRDPAFDVRHPTAHSWRAGSEYVLQIGKRPRILRSSGPGRARRRSVFTESST